MEEMPAAVRKIQAQAWHVSSFMIGSLVLLRTTGGFLGTPWAALVGRSATAATSGFVLGDSGSSPQKSYTATAVKVFEREVPLLSAIMATVHTD
jgi:hypothetical protein